MSRFFGRVVLYVGALALCATHLFAATGEYRAAVLADTPLAYYPLDETSGSTAKDISGNALHGTYSNVTLGTSGALGSATSAGSFNGSTSYVQLPGTWGGGAEVTIEAWINTATSGTAQAVVSSTGPTFVQLQTTSNTLFFKQDTTSVSMPAVPENVGTWTHVALVVKSGASSLYVNGVVSGSTDVTTFTSILASGDVRIGQGVSPGRYFNGKIDEVAIYNYALTQSQLQAHIAAQSDDPFISATSGNWSSTGTWTNGRVPTYTDDVTINGGHTVTVDTASLTVSSLTVLGTLDVSSFGLTVTNNATVAGTINGTFDLTLSGTTGSQLIGLGTINAPVTFGTGTREIPVGESPDLTGSVTVNGSVTNNGDVTMTNAAGISGGGSWTQGTNAILHLEGNVLIPTFNATATGNTVDFTGSSQSVPGGSYYHLTTTGAPETRTLAANVTVSGDLTVAGTLDMDGKNLTILGDLTGSGTIDLANSVSVDGTLALEGDNASFSGSVTPQYDITLTGGNAQSIRGATYSSLNVNKPAGTATLAGNATATFFNLSSGTFSDGGFTLSSGGTITLGAGTTLRIAATMPSGTHITDPASNVYYDGNGNQSIAISVLYGNLFLTTGNSNAVKSLSAAGTLYAQAIDVTSSGTGTVTLDGSGNSIDVAGDLTGSGNLNNSSGTLYLGGNMSLTGSWNTTGSLVIYDGSGAQSVRGTAYEDLTFNKSGGTATLAGNASVANLLDINTGTFNLGGFNLSANGNVEVDSTLSISTGVLNVAGDVNVNGTLNAGAGSIQLTGGTLQTWGGTSAGLTLNNLAINGAGGMQFSAYDITLGGLLNLGGGDVRVGSGRKLVLNSTASMSRTSGAVRGTVAWSIPSGQLRRFEVATNSSGSYSPIEITPNVAAAISVFVDDASVTSRVGAKWTLSGDPATVDLHYEWQNGNWGGDIRGFVPVLYDGSTYSFPAGYVDYAGYFAEVNGVSSYAGDWTAGYGQFFGGTSPSVANFSPTSGPAGTPVSLYGSNFTSATGATFNGTTADVFSVVNDNEIATEVPIGATTGTIVVSDGVSSAGSFNSFTVATPATIQTAASGNWSSPSTWQGGVVPASYDNAVINHAVTVDTNSSITGIQVNNNLSGSFSLSVTGTMDWNSGTISAPLFLGGTSALNVASASTHILSGSSVQSSGTITLAGNDLFLANGASITSSGTIDIAGDFDLVWNGSGAAGSIYNSGTITKSSGPGTSLLGGGSTLTTIDTISATAGTLQITSAVITANLASSRIGRITTNTSTPKYFQVANGATMQFSNGGTFIDGSDFSGSGTFLVSAASTFSGAITSSATNFIIDTSATITWSAATWSGNLTWKQSAFTGTLTLSSGTLGAATSGGSRSFNGLTLTNNATIALASANIDLSNGTSVTNSGTIDFQGDYTFNWDNGGPTPAIINNSTITKSAGSGTATIGNGATFTNTGTVSAAGGTLSISSSINSSGTFSASSGCTVEFISGASFTNGTSFSGSGTIDIKSAATFGGAIAAGATVVGIRGSNTMTFNAATVTGTLIWKEATITGSGLTIPSGSLLKVLSGSGTATLDAGSMTIDGDLQLNANVGIRNGATFTLGSTGVLTFLGGYTFGYDGTGANPTMGLSGLVTKTLSTSTASISCGGVCTNTATGKLRSSAGTLAFTTGLTNNGTIEFPIAGGTPLVDFGKIAVSGGTLTLSGPASVVVDPLYVPDGGTAFQVMTFASRSGDFTTKNYTFATIRSMSDAYGANDLTLTASGPAISSVSPNTGDVAGGDSVTITGTGFAGTTPGENFTGTVYFDTAQAVPMLWQSSTQLVGFTPAHIAGAVNVKVTNANGEAHTATSAFTYVVPVSTLDVTTNADSGAGSLRDAIIQANSGTCSPNCTITFSIGSGLQTINLSTALPTITASGVTIDGTTQEGFAGTPLIDINGAGTVGQNAKGLVLSGGSAIIKSLLIRNFTDGYPYGYGIHVTSSGNTIKGCWLGTDSNGTAASANRVGIVVDGAGGTGNTIGGTSANDRNLISANTASGISLEYGAASNTVIGNYIGTDVSGSVDLGNAFNGVNIESSNNNVIGGSTASERNVISGNDSPNVLIWTTSSGNVVKGNYIGTNAAGNAALGNGDTGVSIANAATGNTIGGTSAGEGNLVSGNAGDGIQLSDAGTTGNTVAGNYVGLDASGSTAIANAFSGIAVINGAASNTIGGNSAGARNVASGNGTQGIAILDSGSNSNVVKGNYCGLNAAGTAAVPNGFHGIAIWNGAASNTIGGTSPSDRNVASGNTFSGIALDGTSGNTIAGNLIGRNAADSAGVPNSIHGIELFNGASGNTIGGASAAAANKITGHTGGHGIDISDAATSNNLIQNNVITGNNGGVALTSTAGTGNRISQNQISGNSTMAIDLDDDGFVTANDPTDSDTGPNNRQNFPVLANATLSGSNLSVDATINSSGSAAGGLVIELFKADASAPEQALAYLGSTGCLGTTLSNAPISMTVAGLSAGDKIVATATSYNAGCTTVQDGTSELSAAATVSGPTTSVSISKTAPANVVVNQTFSYTITVNNSGANPATSVSISDVIQAGMTASNISAPSFSCGGTTTLTCTAATLAAGTHTITFDVTAPSTPQSISNVVNLSASNDSTSGDNTSTAVTNVGSAAADLAVTVSPSSGSVAVGSTMTWTVTVTNNGPSTATSVVLTDTIPSGQTITNAGSCGVAGSVVTCSLGTITSGNFVSAVITVTADEGGTRLNQATAVGSEADPTAGNDVGTATVIVTGDSTLVVTNNNPSGTGSLTQAILDANAGYCPAPCGITFNIGGSAVISAAQPALTAVQTTIDGTTQPGYAVGSPVVSLDGSSQAPGTHGLVLQSSDIVKGLSISGYTDGIRVQGAGARVADNTVFNNTTGVSVLSAATGVRILGNSIHSNTGLPIDHEGNNTVEALDAGDTDIGANNRQNAPVISLVEITPTDLDVTFSVDSSGVPSTQSLYVEVFKTDGSGEPQTLLGGQCFAGNNLVNQLINVPTGSVVNGNTLVATATSYTDAACTTINDGTSEVSAAAVAGNCVPPPVTITGPTQVCAGGSVTLDAGSGFASYLWTPGNFTTQTINVTPSATTTYTVTVTDGSGCANSDTHVVTFNTAAPATITPGGPTTFCTGGSVVLTASAGASYLWSPGGQTTQSITATAAGSYSVTVTDVNGCVATSPATSVTVNSAPPVTITGPSTSCPSSSVTLTATAGFTSYLWQPGNLTTSSITVTPASTTTYTLTATDSNGCQSSTTHTVTVTSTPSVSITGPTTSCPSSSVTLTATAGFAGYLWQPGNLTGQSITVSPAGTTTYSLTATAAGGCTASASHTVTVTTPAPATATASGPTTFCAGGQVVLTASAGASYQWLPNGETTPSITVTASGTYSVVVTDGSGCSTTSNSITVTVNPLPAVTITGPTATCNATPVTLDAGPGASYLWTPGNFTTQTITVTPSATTTYSVTVTDVNGCTGSDTHTVTVTSNPTANVTAPAAICAGATGTAFTGITPGATYTWSATNGVITSGNGTSSVNFQPTGTSPVVLNVTVAAGSCTATGSATVNVNPAPATPAITAPPSVAAGSSGNTASITPQAGALYAWTITGGTIDGPANGPSISFTAGGSSPVTLDVTVNLNGCLASASTSVTVTGVAPAPDQADLAVTKSAPSSITTGASFTYTITVTNGGPKPAINVALSDVLPAGLTVLGFDAGLWSCGTAAGQFNCSIPSLDPGAFTIITLSVQAPSRAGTIVNSVSVSSAIDDPDLSNNSASASTNVVAPSATCPATAPALLAPANGATVTAPVALSWSPVSGAASYDVWTSLDGVLTLAGSTSSTSLTVNAASGTTSWYVVAHGGTGCISLTSSTRTFTVNPSANCATHGKPQITAPAQSIVASPLTIAWTPVPQAVGYRVWISVDGTALQDVGTTDGAISLSVSVPPGAITAFVDALFNGCPPTRSDGVSFEVAQPDPCAGRGPATLSSPANNSLLNSSAVDLRWNAAPSLRGIAPQYRVWTSVDGEAPEVRGTTSDTSFRAVFERGQVVWFVETLYPGCPSTESARFNFTIPARNECGTAKPSLSSPSGVTVSSANVTFIWTGVSDAIGYEVYLALADESPSLIGTTPAGVTSFNYLVPPGRLTWFVRALIDRCPSRDSVTARFTYEPPAACENNDRPLPIAPLGGQSITSPATFSWSAPAGAVRYELYLHRPAQPPALAAATAAPEAPGIALAAGTYQWFVRAFFNGCSPLDSATEEITVVAAPPACAVLTPPVVSAPGQISSGVEFLMQWTPAPGATSYQLQLSSAESFANAETITTTGTEHAVIRTNTTASPVAVYARVRAIDSRCTPPTVTPYGPTTAVFVLPQQGSEAAAPLTNDGPLTYRIPLGPQFAGQTFTATPTRPWLSVTPSSGVVPAGGTSLLVTANTNALFLGTNLGAVTVTLTTPSSRIGTNGTTSVSTTVSVNLVTPVTPAPKSTPPPDALIIPAVANADGVNSHFQSDVRVSNTSPQLMKYQLTFTPTGEAGISSGRQTTFSIEPGQTVALDDILKSWFGTGPVSSTGTLEVRPLTQTATTTSSAAIGALANLATFASSRTFNVTPNGTFGQHIPAIPYANFIGKAGNAVLSLQQIAQSARYRTNLGVVEGSGEPASLLVKVFGSSGAKLTEFPLTLNGGQHMQLNSALASKGINDLTDGRIEVQVTSGNGKVTAYASVLDNQTSDPLLVSPVTLTEAGNSKWVIPGVADLNNGVANWQTDTRIFNAGTTDATATLSFYSQNGGEPKTATITIPAGQVRTLDKTLANVFGVANDGGAVHITTNGDARLIATARTYNQTSGGTYGQFISAVTPAEAAGVGTRPLQLLQVEESNRFRSNIGLAEVTGNPVKLEISIVPPDAKFTAVATVDLAANEFRQIGSLLKSVGLDNTYNARVTVRAIDGTGRVAAYASVIDMETNDPTYVPAQ